MVFSIPQINNAVMEVNSLTQQNIEIIQDLSLRRIKEI